VTGVFETPQDLLVLHTQSIGRENRVSLGGRVVSQAVHELRQLIVSAATLTAVRQVLGNWRIDQLALPLREIALEETLFRNVPSPADHGWPPRSARSLRAARNR
jgi:hypothetical protein